MHRVPCTSTRPASSPMPRGARCASAGLNPVHQITASNDASLPSAHATPLDVESGKGLARSEDAPRSSVHHRRHHHDVAEAARQVFDRPAFLLGAPTFGRAFEQHAAVHVVGQEIGCLLGHPQRLGDLRHLGQDLRARVAATVDQDALICERRRSGIVGRVQLPACEHLATGVGRHEGSAPASGGAHHGLGVPCLGARAHDEPVSASLDDIDQRRPTNRQGIAFLVLAQVADDFIPRRKALRRCRHEPAGQRFPIGRREEPQGLPCMTPGAAGSVLGVEDHERALRASQEVARRQGRLAAADDDHVAAGHGTHHQAGARVRKERCARSADQRGAIGRCGVIASI